MNFSFPVAEQALSQGLYPDIISSDATARTFAGVPDMKDLAFVMSKILEYGNETFSNFPFCYRCTCEMSPVKKQAGREN